MFNDIISSLSRTEETFNNQVNDVFGQSIDNDVFMPVIEELQKLELARNETELTEKEIQTLSLELNMIL
ncbi:hypothetical protein [Succinimonas sp.]|uniref:hypothetical protein n=1 Tax=Succinimonas sp. TaxID=1936151 RepID=UPI003865CB08